MKRRPIAIDITRVRDDRYIARVRNEPSIWASGKTPNQALADMILSHPEYFNVSVNYQPPMISDGEFSNVETV